MLNKLKISNVLYPTIIGIMLLTAAWQWGQAIKIYGKAHLAKWLISQAWQDTLISGKNTKPWPWADTWPVAKISFPNNEVFYILAGGAGNSLAFGPGHLNSTALPGETGTSIVGGHRDTHFASLQNIQQGDNFSVQNKNKEWKHYSTNSFWVANSETEPLLFDPQEEALYLITCYPFNSLAPNSDKRFIVKAEITNMEI